LGRHERLKETPGGFSPLPPHLRIEKRDVADGNVGGDVGRQVGGDRHAFQIAVQSSPEQQPCLKHRVHQNMLFNRYED
jgi:hypothetical protein